MRPSFLGKTEEVDKLTASELATWELYQKYLGCFDWSMLTPDGVAIAAALLTLATETRIKRKVGGY